MRCTVPITIGDAQLISSNVPVYGAGEVPYDTNATYAMDARAVDPVTHRVYQSLQAGNKGHALPVYPVKKNDWWYDVGATNQRAMFDLRSTQRTVGVDLPGGGSMLKVRIAPGERVNTVSVRGMVADHISVAVFMSGAQVYLEQEDLRIREVLNHYQYAYKEWTTREKFVRFNLPPFTTAEIEITLTRLTTGVACSGVVLGTYAYMGDTKYEAESDVLNFSVIERDKYGDLATLTPIRNVPKGTYTLKLDKRYVKAVRDLRDETNAVPALYTAIDDSRDGWFDVLDLLGIYKQFKITVKSVTTAEVYIELEGM